MESSQEQCPVSPLTSPVIKVHKPTEFVVLPTRRSDESPVPRPNRRSRFEENIDLGPGIQIAPMTSQSPAEHNTQDMRVQKSRLYSPAGSSAQLPLYARTTDTSYSHRSNASNVSRLAKDLTTERLVAHRATQSTRWRIHWHLPSLIVFAFCMGVVLAFLQHVLYSYLHHRPVDDEGKKYRSVLYGRALAYFSKVAFAGCAILVLRQRMWRTFQEQALTILSIDQIFHATEDPSLFINWEAWSQAPILVAMAVIIWLIPLATIIFSPGALTFGNYMQTETVNLMVPTINFSREAYGDWRDAPKLPDGSNRRSVMYYNTTDKSGKSAGFFDYYDQPSAEMRRIAILLAYSDLNHANLQLGATQDICGGGKYNCDYTQTFLGPGYQCSTIANGLNDTVRLKDYGSPVNMSLLVPQGRSIYLSRSDLGAYGSQAGPFLKGPGGVPEGTPDANLGVFKAQPILWIGYSVSSNVTIDPNSTYGNYKFRYDPKIIRCVHKETRYTVRWNFTNAEFHYDVKREYLAPIIDTSLALGADGFLTTALDPQPKSNWISPRTDVPRYKKTAAYNAIGAMFRDFLRGQIDLDPVFPGPSYPIVDSDITKTRLVDKSTAPRANLMEELEAFYSDMVLSLFSMPAMLAIDRERISVNRSKVLSSFVYYPRRLWQCYVPVIFVTLVIMLFGAWTIWLDGATFSTGFSRILVTTRNTTLDDMSRGACLGNDPFPGELMRTKLKFGVLATEGKDEYGEGAKMDGVGHCAFGVPSEIGPVRKGVPYAGLPERGMRRRQARG